MRVCKGCGIGIGESLSIKYKTILYCKTCYREYQKEQFKFWYDKQPRKNYKHNCIICNKEFEDSQPKTKVCSHKCRLAKKRNYERMRRAKAKA